MQDKIKQFILLGNKAKVLLKIENNNEPRVNVLVGSDGRAIYTFNSSCFPFFSENEFETVDESKVNIFLEKCELYVKNLENNLKIEFDKPKEGLKDLPKPIGNQGVPNPTRSSFLIKTKDRKLRITTQVCQVHKKDIDNAVTETKDQTCYPHNTIVEELAN